MLIWGATNLEHSHEYLCVYTCIAIAVSVVKKVLTPYERFTEEGGAMKQNLTDVYLVKANCHGFFVVLRARTQLSSFSSWSMDFAHNPLHTHFTIIYDLLCHVPHHQDRLVIQGQELLHLLLERAVREDAVNTIDRHGTPRHMHAPPPTPNHPWNFEHHNYQHRSCFLHACAQSRLAM